MRKRSSLGRLNKSLVHRIRYLESLAATIAGGHDHAADRALSFISIEALATWSAFVREFYLSCALLRPRTIGGQVVRHRGASIGTEKDALLHSIMVLKGPSSPSYRSAANSPRIAPRDEPAWHEKRVLLALSSSISLTNNLAVTTGLSYPTTFFDDLPPVRNFYAHRSSNTAERIARIANRKYAIAQLRHPNDFMNNLIPGRAQPLLMEWLGDIRRVSDALCQ
jgi:hypothetical protein